MGHGSYSSSFLTLQPKAKKDCDSDHKYAVFKKDNVPDPHWIIGGHCLHGGMSAYPLSGVGGGLRVRLRTSTMSLGWWGRWQFAIRSLQESPAPKFYFRREERGQDDGGRASRGASSHMGRRAARNRF